MKRKDTVNWHTLTPAPKDTVIFPCGCTGEISFEDSVYYSMGIRKWILRNKCQQHKQIIFRDRFNFLLYKLNLVAICEKKDFNKKAVHWYSPAPLNCVKANGGYCIDFGPKIIYGDEMYNKIQETRK